VIHDAPVARIHTSWKRVLLEKCAEKCRKICFAVSFSRCKEILHEAVINQKVKSDRRICKLRGKTRSALFRKVRNHDEKLSEYVMEEPKKCFCHRCSHFCSGEALRTRKLFPTLVGTNVALPKFQRLLHSSHCSSLKKFPRKQAKCACAKRKCTRDS
jgi:hypothetical protein